MTQVSVIIPTYNGENKIKTIVESLLNQSWKEFEVIIVNDGSVDNTEMVVNSLITKYPFAIKLISQENKGRSAVRNLGAKEAVGNLLIFFDDDMRLTPECIEKHVKWQKFHQGSIIVGSVPEDFVRAGTDVQRFKASLSRKWNEGFSEEQKPLDKEDIFLTAANFSISKRIFNQLNGFDERLNDNEDFDLAVRAYLLKIPIFFKPEIIAWHDDFVTLRSFIYRQREYQKAHVRYASLKPDIAKEFNRYQLPVLNPASKMVYSLFADKKWVDIVDKGWLLKLLPLDARYKLYSIISTALSVYFPDRKL